VGLGDGLKLGLRLIGMDRLVGANLSLDTIVTELPEFKVSIKFLLFVNKRR